MDKVQEFYCIPCPEDDSGERQKRQKEQHAETKFEKVPQAGKIKASGTFLGFCTASHNL
ncbi:MAG: hypothetical protein HFH84_10295 [Lachnospiraceae bacterium]|nr:hypothetical protein [Lachnospiraceae bacterium]